MRFPIHLYFSFNFLKLLNRILLYHFQRRYVITSFLMTSRLCHHYVVMW